MELSLDEKIAYLEKQMHTVEEDMANTSNAHDYFTYDRIWNRLYKEYAKLLDKKYNPFAKQDEYSC